MSAQSIQEGFSIHPFWIIPIHWIVFNEHPSIHPESIEAPGTWLDRSTTTSPESPRSALRSHWLLDRLWPLERYDGLVTSQWDRRNWWVGKKWDGCEDVGYRALGPVSATDVLGEKLGKLLQVVRRHQTHLEKVQFKLWNIEGLMTQVEFQWSWCKCLMWWQLWNRKGGPGPSGFLPWTIQGQMLVCRAPANIIIIMIRNRRGANRDFHPIQSTHSFEYLSLYIQKHLSQSAAVCDTSGPLVDNL